MADVDLPLRLSMNDLANLWKLTPARIGQFVRDKRLVRGEDGKVDRDEALAFRAVQISKQETNMLFQHYGNRHGQYAPKIVDHVEPGRKLTDDEILYGTDDDEPAAPANDVMSVALQRNLAVSEMRLAGERIKVQRAEARLAREAGELIERTVIFRDMHKAAATIQRLLRTLEHDIPAIFADTDTRADVRRKVETIVDRCLHAMTKQLGKHESPDEAAFSAEEDD